jgi:hypothetical protein
MDADVLNSTVLAVVSAVIAAVAAGISARRSILAGRQAREARKSRELSAVIALYSAHQSEEASRIRPLIRSGEIVGQLDDAETRSRLRHYINQLNFVATLRARGLLSEELLQDLFFEPAKACWERCAKPFVREIRETENPDFARELQRWIGAPDP